MRRRVAVFVARAGVRATFDQRLDHGRHGRVVVEHRRQVKRRCASFHARGGVRAGRKGGLHFGSGSAPRRLEQIVRRVGANGKRRQRQGDAKQIKASQPRTARAAHSPARIAAPARRRPPASNARPRRRSWRQCLWPWCCSRKVQAMHRSKSASHNAAPGAASKPGCATTPHHGTAPGGSVASVAAVSGMVQRQRHSARASPPYQRAAARGWAAA